MTVDVSTENMGKCGIPEHMHASLLRYFNHHVPTGDFLRAVIRNDLRGAVEKADDVNQHCLHNYIKFFYSYAPVGSWGSPTAWDFWLSQRTV